jgi:hypothetical protein
LLTKSFTTLKSGRIQGLAAANANPKRLLLLTNARTFNAITARKSVEKLLTGSPQNNSIFEFKRM